MIEKLRDALYNLGNEPNAPFIMESTKDNMIGMMPVTDHDCGTPRAILRAIKKQGITP